MTATAVSRGTSTTQPRPVAILDDVLLGLIDIGDNVRDDAGELDDLAANIAANGQLQPVKVTLQTSGRYMLVYGQRRVLACRQLGRQRIQAIVEPPSVVDQIGAVRSIAQLSENLVRKDLNPIEEAVALREVLDADPGLTQEALADQLAMSRPWVSNTLGLLDAAPAVQEHVRAGTLTAAHAKAIRGLGSEDQADLATKAISGRWSAHDTERQAKWAKDNAKQRAKDREKDKAHAAIAVAALEKAVAKDTTVITWNDTIADAIAAAGYTDVRRSLPYGAYDTVDNAGECGCRAWKVESYYNEDPKVVPACIDQEHINARNVARRAGRDAENAQRAADARAREASAKGRIARLKGWLKDHPDDPLRQHLLIYVLADDDDLSDALVARYLAGEDEAAHEAREDARWDAILAIPAEELAVVLGDLIADSVDDQWRISTVVFAAIDERVPPPKGRKPAAG